MVAPDQGLQQVEEAACSVSLSSDLECFRTALVDVTSHLFAGANTIYGS